MEGEGGQGIRWGLQGKSSGFCLACKFSFFASGDYLSSDVSVYM